MEIVEIDWDLLWESKSGNIISPIAYTVKGKSERAPSREQPSVLPVRPLLG
jgi:hypothetical protein